MNHETMLRVYRDPRGHADKIKACQEFLKRAGLSPGPIDGAWGPKTEAAMNEALTDWWRGICIQYNWDFMPTSKHARQLTSLRSGRGRVSPLEFIVWHWPGSTETAERLGRYWNETTRSVSSHAGLDENRVIWYVPPHLTAWHASEANHVSIGIDICVPPQTIHRRNAENRGVYAGVSEENKNLMNLHPSIAAKAGELRNVLNKHVSIPGAVDHASLTRRKIDCVIWRKSLERYGAM